jgi:sensor c-di-GMP phosphodiesterase-like protein
MTGGVPAEHLDRLRALGTQLTVDDFGTGYSSLAYLHRLGVDTLKIDGSFVAGLGQHNATGVVTSAMIQVAKALGLGVVAESVETADQMTELRQLGCDNMQGFYFSVPLPADDLVIMLRDPERLAASIEDIPRQRPSMTQVVRSDS